MAHPPGSDTRASPQRARGVPRTGFEARMVFTRWEGASGSDRRSALRDRPKRSSRETSTPICASSRSMVLTSLRCGTLESVSCSLVSNPAHISGSAAFFAPETRISPESGTPPWMMSLSIRRLFGSERAHRQRMNLPAHALPERRIDELMALHAALAAERFAHDERLEMLSVAHDAYFAALQPLLDIVLNLLRCHHVNASTCNRS